MNKTLAVVGLVGLFAFSCGSSNEVSEEEKQEVLQMEEQNNELGNEILTVQEIEEELDSLNNELEAIINE